MTLTIDVSLVPDEIAHVANPPAAAAVIDVIRATTSITTALDSGAASVTPAETVEEARRLAVEGEALLCGERSGVPPEGFDFGNSPGDYTSEHVEGRDLVFTTTNGTRAMRLTAATGSDGIWLA